MSSRSVCAAWLAVSVMVVCQGCSGDKEKDTRANVAGTWLEIRDGEGAAGNPRFQAQPPKTKNILQLTCNADGSFKAVLCTPDGKPLPDGKAVDGKWRWDKASLVFEVSNNTLDANLKDMAPNRGSGVQKFATEAGQEFDRMVVWTEGGASLSFKRVP